ncbi:ABC transporter permease [uncultured Sulfitobacter sp.]|uniref:ABC transporter permease n=1 Tax=uncultured Sulfitobacter sp. TaxID=191468 RepID=UPI002622D46F|nr:ABC transporter permease [uncultured Sulfitobacter sp.]
MSSSSQDPSTLRPVHQRVRAYATPRTIMALILREMSTRYGRSAGGFIWAILEPLGVIIILALAFSLLFRTPALGTSFVLFYASGYLPFHVYQSVSLFVSRALNFSRPLMFYPSVTWIDALLARFILNTLTGFMVTYIVLAGMILTIDTRIVLDVMPIIWALSLAALLGLAVGALNCALIGLIQTWDLIWSIVSRPLFLASGILFIYEDMPQFIQNILWYNPIIHVVGILRTGLYPMYNADYASSAYVIGFSLIALALGLLLLHRFHKDILNEN